MLKIVCPINSYQVGIMKAVKI